MFGRKGRVGGEAGKTVLSEGGFLGALSVLVFVDFVRTTQDSTSAFAQRSRRAYCAIWAGCIGRRGRADSIICVVHEEVKGRAERGKGVE